MFIYKMALRKLNARLTVLLREKVFSLTTRAIRLLDLLVVMNFWARALVSVCGSLACTQSAIRYQVG